PAVQASRSGTEVLKSMVAFLPTKRTSRTAFEQHRPAVDLSMPVWPVWQREEMLLFSLVRVARSKDGLLRPHLALPTSPQKANISAGIARSLSRQRTTGMKQRLLTPGPTPVPEETLLELARPVIYHRGGQFRQILAEVL